MAVPLSDIQDDYLRRVERERRRREDELLVLLLALMGGLSNKIVGDFKDGFDTAATIRNRILGSPHHRGAALDIARAMAKAHRDGYRRAGLAAGTTLVERDDAGSIVALTELYLVAAGRAARAMAGALIERVQAALAQARLSATMGRDLRRAVRAAFESAGYAETEGHAYALDLAAERAVVAAHSDGLMRAIQERPDLNVTGIRHVSIIDERTTDICRERHELQLPVDHPYWQTNVPSLHWRCRSTLRPLFGPFTPSETLPVTQPMPGFGRNPLPPLFMRAA